MKIFNIFKRTSSDFVGRLFGRIVVAFAVRALFARADPACDPFCVGNSAPTAPQRKNHVYVRSRVQVK